MRINYKLASLTLCSIILSACKSGYNVVFEQPSSSSKVAEIACGSDTTPATANTTTNTQDTLKLLADLSCKTDLDGFLVGQNLGNGNDIATDNGDRSYDTLVDPIKTQTNHTPAIVSIDYEFNREYSETELNSANLELRDHVVKGGIVMVSWSPLNPWTSDDPDNPDQDRLAYTEDVDLTALLDENSSTGINWLATLDRIASRLNNLRNLGVTVLFRPLPEMNSQAVWWGTQADSDINTAKHDAYISVWRDMFDYFASTTHGLNNILWVYSPLSLSDGDAKSNVSWAYPDAQYVDVVAGVELNNTLNIRDYKLLSDLGHPLGMAKYGPSTTDEDNETRDAQSFDNREYINTLKEDYPNVGFWVSWHDIDINDSETAYLSLINQQQLNGLMNMDEAMSIEKLIDDNLNITN